MIRRVLLLLVIALLVACAAPSAPASGVDTVAVFAFTENHWRITERNGPSERLLCAASGPGVDRESPRTIIAICTLTGGR